MNDEPAKGFQDEDDIPERSPLWVFLFAVHKAHLEMAEAKEEELVSRYQSITTRGHARAYLEELMPRIVEMREQRRREGRAG